ncbi:hypothetical protein NDU88_001414 [Pleurodeles waltl]|uniref:Uncharacterized protein n=1 Tax=Pleurodeles waltl TaxID=8319 RepID=A0AAV7LXK3_PLEWA|nr:hypothetical protein NDU88_001414 [Pleurodeles waltl]
MCGHSISRLRERAARARGLSSGVQTLREPLQSLIMNSVPGAPKARIYTAPDPQRHRTRVPSLPNRVHFRRLLKIKNNEMKQLRC